MTVNEKLDEIEARFDSDSAEEVIYAVPSMVKALRDVLELAYMNAVGSEYEHNEGCEGEAECPACWAADIRRAITEALDGAA